MFAVKRLRHWAKFITSFILEYNAMVIGDNYKTDKNDAFVTSLISVNSVNNVIIGHAVILSS